MKLCVKNESVAISTLGLALLLWICACVICVEEAAAQQKSAPQFIDPNASSQALSDIPVRSIRFLTTDDFPPFNFVGPTGNLAGYNIELARAICSEVKARCTVQALPWDEIRAAVKAKKGDAIIAGLAPSRDTLSRYAFTRSYFRFPGRFFAANSEASGDLEVSPGNLKGQSVGVLRNTRHAQFLEAHFPDVDATLFDDFAALASAVQRNEVAFGFGDGMQISFWLQSSVARDCCTLVGGAYHSLEYFGPGMLIAVPQDRQDLKDVLDASLQALNRNGKMNELFLRYFPVNFF